MTGRCHDCLHGVEAHGENGCTEADCGCRCVPIPARSPREKPGRSRSRGRVGKDAAAGERQEQEAMPF